MSSLNLCLIFIVHYLFAFLIEYNKLVLLTISYFPMHLKHDQTSEFFNMFSSICTYTPIMIATSWCTLIQLSSSKLMQEVCWYAQACIYCLLAGLTYDYLLYYSIRIPTLIQLSSSKLMQGMCWYAQSRI